MLVSLILLTLCLSLFALIYYKLRSGQKNIKKESLVNTYDSLIRLLKERKQLNIEEIKLTSVLLKSRADRSRTTYGLFEIENRLCVTWQLENATIGTRGKEWSFEQNHNQQMIFQEIQKDIQEYMNTLNRTVLN